MPHIGPYYHKKPGFKQQGPWGWNTELMWSKIDRQPDSNGCHNAKSAMSPTGALMGAWKNGQQQMTQIRRLVWMTVNDRDVSEYQVKLTCGNQRCCNPEHFVIKPTNKQQHNDLKPAEPTSTRTKPPQERWWG